MSWAEVKKINDNLSIPLDQLILNFFGGIREYYYSSDKYIVPFDGVYTIRAYTGKYGSYGKVFYKFKKGQEINFDFLDNSSIIINSPTIDDNEFSIKLSLDSIVNAPNNGIGGLVIGGSYSGSKGGNATIRCNNGIASGGGGASSLYVNASSLSNSRNVIGFDGGTAFAFGNNCYALGGGGGASGLIRNNNTIPSVHANGGKAFINDIEIDEHCSFARNQQLKSGYGGNGCDVMRTSSDSEWYDTVLGSTAFLGGCGGCGGGSRASSNMRATTNLPNVYDEPYFGLGYFSSGSVVEAHTQYSAYSSRGGSSKGMGIYNHAANYFWSGQTQMYNEFANKFGYFAGGDANPSSRSNYINGGDGGFYGGNSSWGQTAHYPFGFGTGGEGKYGIGGDSYGSITNDTTTWAGNGGRGLIYGGNAGQYNQLSYGSIAGHGGDGYYGGSGTKSQTFVSSNITYIMNSGSDGISTTQKMFLGSSPLRTKKSSDSIVIIEYGKSLEDF